MKKEGQINQRRPIGFKQFKDYCEKIVPLLNDPQMAQKQSSINKKGTNNDNNKEIHWYKASYKILNKKFAKQHDCEYLDIQQVFSTSDSEKQDKTITKNQKVLLKINIIYSLAYQIPLLLFMPYHCNQQSCHEDLKQQEQSDIIQLKPFTKEEIPQVINLKIGSQKLNPSQDETGVFIMQNHINKEYFYTLHHCYMDTHQMTIYQIIPYYLAIIGCHPPIVL